MKKHPIPLLQLIFCTCVLSSTFYSTISSTPELNQVQSLLTALKSKLVELLTTINELTNPSHTIIPEPELTEAQKEELNELENNVKNIVPDLDTKTPTEIQELIQKLEQTSHEHKGKQIESVSLNTQVEKIREAALKSSSKQPITEIIKQASEDKDPLTVGVQRRRGGVEADPEALRLCLLIKKNNENKTLDEYFQSLHKSELKEIKEIIKNESLEEEPDEFDDEEDDDKEYKDGAISEAFQQGGFDLSILKNAHEKETTIRKKIKLEKTSSIENIKKTQTETDTELKKIEKATELDDDFFTRILPNIWINNFQNWLNPATHNYNPAYEEITKVLATQTNINKILTSITEKQQALALIQEILKADQIIKNREIEEKKQFQELLEDKTIDFSGPLFSSIQTTMVNYLLKEPYWKKDRPEADAKNKLNDITPQIIKQPWQPNEEFFNNLLALWAVDFNEWIESLMTETNGQKLIQGQNLIQNLGKKENRIKICNALETNQPKAIAIISCILLANRGIQAMRQKIEEQNKENLSAILRDAYLPNTPLKNQINNKTNAKFYNYFINKLIHGNEQFWTSCLSQLKDAPNQHTVAALGNIYNFINQTIQNNPRLKPENIEKINNGVLKALNRKNNSTSSTKFANFIAPTK